MPPVPGYPPPPTPFMPGPSSQQHLDRQTPVMPRRPRYESEPERPVIVSGTDYHNLQCINTYFYISSRTYLIVSFLRITGRSSVNDSSIYNPPESEFESLLHNDTGYGHGGPPFDHVTETSPQRMTPRKFLSAHSIGTSQIMLFLIVCSRNLFIEVFVIPMLRLHLQVWLRHWVSYWNWTAILWPSKSRVSERCWRIYPRLKNWRDFQGLY